MSKVLSEQDKIKKLQTNVKSAQSTFALAGILALVYIARYFITGNFEFYFSLYITEFLLKAADINTVSPVTISAAPAYTALAVFVMLYILCAILSLKSSVGLWLCLLIYALDFIALIAGTAAAPFSAVTETAFIDIIIHVFVILFLVVGAYSNNKLKKIKS